MKRVFLSVLSVLLLLALVACGAPLSFSNLPVDQLFQSTASTTSDSAEPSDSSDSSTSEPMGEPSDSSSASSSEPSSSSSSSSSSSTSKPATSTSTTEDNRYDLPELTPSEPAGTSDFITSKQPNSVTILGYNGSATAISIPETIDGLPVTTIAEGAFQSCTTLTQVTLPSSLTTIGANAFAGCSALPILYLSDSVTSVGAGAFRGCTNLVLVLAGTGSAWSSYKDASTPVYTNISAANYGVLENGIHYILGTSAATVVRYAFTNTNIVNIPTTISSKSVTEIGKYAFYQASTIKQLSIPSTVTKLGDLAFAECTALEKLTYNAPAVQDLTASAGVMRNIGVSAPFGVSVRIGSNVTALPAYLFYECSGITSVTMGENVQTLGKYLFYGCAGLSSISLGSKITALPDYLFYGCESLQTISYSNDVTSLGRYLFYGCERLSAFTIGSKITTLPEYAFYGCKSLTTLTLDKTITTIGDHALDGCTGLTSLLYNIPSISLGSAAEPHIFDGIGMTATNGLTVTIGDDVTTLPAHLFEGCTGITGLVIGKNVTSLGDGVFAGCTDLVSLQYNATNASCSSNVNNNVFQSIGTAATNGAAVTIGDNVTSLPAYLFYGCTGIRTLRVGKALTALDATTFKNCSGVTSFYYNIVSLTAPANQETPFFFNGEGGMIEMVIGKDVTTIPDYLMSGAIELVSLSFEAGSKCTTIGKCAFKGCGFIETLSLPTDGNLRVIGEQAFYQINVPSIVIPNGVTTLESQCFYQKSRTSSILEYVVIPASVTALHEIAFFNLNSTTFIGFFYYGTEAQWNALLPDTFETATSPLNPDDTNTRRADVYFYSESAQSTGNYWHMVADVPTKW